MPAKHVAGVWGGRAGGTVAEGTVAQEASFGLRPAQSGASAPARASRPHPIPLAQATCCT